VVRGHRLLGDVVPHPGHARDDAAGTELQQDARQSERFVAGTDGGEPDLAGREHDMLGGERGLIELVGEDRTVDHAQR
jgi:hypothetical protein